MYAFLLTWKSFCPETGWTPFCRRKFKMLLHVCCKVRAW
jgi:hypothetical protein